MAEKLDLKRIGIYLLITFGFTWGGHLIIYLNGGLTDSPEIIEGLGLRLSLVLLIVSMFGPMLGHIGTRLITREGWQNVWLWPKLRQGWKYWLIAWLSIPVLIGVGAAVYYLFFPQHFDPNSTLLKEQLAAAAPGAENQIGLILIAQVAAGILLAPVLNALPIFGEEFGWRAYLQPKLLPLGERWMMIVSGIIWGLWHAPVIAMGYNYGFDYPGAPWAGILLFCWFTFIVGVILGWTTLRAGSVWPAVIGHGIVNGFAGIVAFFTQGEPLSLLGPAAVGVIGSSGLAVFALWLFFFRLRGEFVGEREDLPTELSPTG